MTRVEPIPSEAVWKRSRESSSDQNRLMIVQGEICQEIKACGTKTGEDWEREQTVRFFFCEFFLVA